MPYTAKQHRLFEAAAHDPAVASRVGIPVGTAQTMASEGVKAVAPIQRGRGQQMAALLKKK
jgi:hypothetical protein